MVIPRRMMVKEGPRLPKKRPGRTRTARTTRAHNAATKAASSLRLLTAINPARVSPREINSIAIGPKGPMLIREFHLAFLIAPF